MVIWWKNFTDQVDSTMWKFHNYSIAQILREISYRGFWSAKSAILTHFETLNFDFYEFSYHLKAESYQINKILCPSNWKILKFPHCEFLILILAQAMSAFSSTFFHYLFFFQILGKFVGQTFPSHMALFKIWHSNWNSCC